MSRRHPDHCRFTSVLLFSMLCSVSSSRRNANTARHLHSRQLTPVPVASDLLARASSTFWHRELQSAERVVSQRRRERHHRQLAYSDGTNCLSPLQRWFVTHIESIPSETWNQVQDYNITTLAYLYKHYVEREDGSKEYFGAYGERTNEMKENHEKLRQFWSEAQTGRNSSSSPESTRDTIASAAASQHLYLTSTEKQSNVILLGMHGDDLALPQKIIPTLQQIYSLDASSARSLAEDIRAVIETLPGGYTNPLLTSNAIATQSSDTNGSQRERDSIIVGDGVFTFLEWLELSADGPDYIHSHEYSHHIQYDMGEQSRGGGGFGDDGMVGSKADETQRLELMADVFGSYFLAHKLGGGFDASRLYDVHRTAYSLGDCKSSDGTHHGTPRQRECASNYGANLALASYVDGGYRMSPEDLRKMFDDKYDAILDLDEKACTPVVDQTTLDKTIYGDDFDGVTTSGVPFYGDNASTNDSKGESIHDSAPSYLEPVVSWFEPKPANYFDAEQSSLLSGQAADAESIPTNNVSSNEQSSYSTGSSSEYGSYQATSPQDNSWDNQEVSVQENTQDPLEQPPHVLENNESIGGNDTGDDWFEQTKWFVGRTFSASSTVRYQGAAIGCLAMPIVTLLILP
ncbi:hypothetical protein ACHAW6_004961 [Cyclotella cf. meneghiniana]